MIKAVLFDLDGTLADSLGDLARSTNYALEKFGFPTYPLERYKLFIGNGMAKLVERVIPEEKRDSETYTEVFDTFMAHYREHYVDTTLPYEGISELVDDIKAQGYKIAIVSNKAQEMAVNVAKKLFGNVFDIVCGKQEGYPAKPDPTLTLKVMDELGVEPQECVFIGDSGMDVATAVNAGCKGIGVLWGFRSKEELLENGADYLVEKPSQILEIIKELNK